MSQNTLSRPEIALHWIVGLGMIAVVAVGLYMTRAQDYALYGMHKSAGIALFAIIVLRVVLRLFKGFPTPVSKGARWEHGLAHVIHWVLLLATIAMPLSGMFDSYGAGRGLNLFGLELIAANIGENGRPEAISAALSTLGESVHGMGANILIAAIVLHIAGAFKHHIIDRDDTLRRMAGRA
jgi:cytochrome b561